MKGGSKIHRFVSLGLATSKDPGPWAPAEACFGQSRNHQRPVLATVFGHGSIIRLRPQDSTGVCKCVSTVKRGLRRQRVVAAKEWASNCFR